LTLLATIITLKKVSKPLLKGSVHQTESMVSNLEGLPNKQENGFDPNAYMLLVRLGYSHEDVNKLTKDNDMTRVEGKQVFIKTRKA